MNLRDIAIDLMYKYPVSISGDKLIVITTFKWQLENICRDNNLVIESTRTVDSVLIEGVFISKG